MNEHKAGASTYGRIVNGVIYPHPGPDGGTENSTTPPAAPSGPTTPNTPNFGVKPVMPRGMVNPLSNAEVERLNFIHRQRSRHRVVPYADIDFLLEMLAKLGVLFHGNR